MSYPIIRSYFLRKYRFTPLRLSPPLLLLCVIFGPLLAGAQTIQFVQVASFGPPYSPQYFVLTGDLNADGKPDLIVLTSGATGLPSTAYVLLGHGDGSFGAAVGYPIGAAPYQATLADLRGNGHLDLIVDNGYAAAVLLGNGDGTFQPLVSYANLGNVTGVTVGDFNGDKKLDLAVADWQLMHGGNTGAVDVVLGNGDGTFGTDIATPLNQTVGQTNSIASGDFNGDGKLDVAGVDGLQVLLGNGDGTFQPPVTYALGATVQIIVAADFNGDGILDLAVSNGDAQLGQVSILLGNGDGTFQTPASIATGIGSLGMAVADVNSDGKLDLVVGTASGFGVWLGNGDGTFSAGTTVSVTGAQGFTSNVAVADFDNSGHPGVAVTTNNSVFVFLQGPLPTISLSPAVLTFAPQSPGTTSSAQTVTLSNDGTATMTVPAIGISGANASAFSQTNNCTSLAPSASCQIMVISAPIAAGTQTASLNITDKAPGSPQTVALTGTGSDFSIGATSQTSITVTPGQAANYSVLVAPTGGFNQAVKLSCSGVPAQSTCTVMPGSVTLNGSDPITVNVAVVTTAVSAGLTQPVSGGAPNNPVALWAAFAGTLGLALMTGAAKYRPAWQPQWCHGLTLICLLTVGITMSACGGGSNTSNGGGTQAGTYTVIVTGNYTLGSTTLTHDTKLTLVVQ